MNGFSPAFAGVKEGVGMVSSMEVFKVRERTKYRDNAGLSEYQKLPWFFR